MSAGSDTVATAIALAAGIRHLAGAELHPHDLVLCGERATDGETGQAGPMVAALLIPVPRVEVSGLRAEMWKSNVGRRIREGMADSSSCAHRGQGRNQPGFPRSQASWPPRGTGDSARP